MLLKSSFKCFRNNSAETHGDRGLPYLPRYLSRPVYRDLSRLLQRTRATPRRSTKYTIDSMRLESGFESAADLGRCLDDQGHHPSINTPLKRRASCDLLQQERQPANY